MVARDGLPKGTRIGLTPVFNTATADVDRLVAALAQRLADSRMRCSHFPQ